MIPHTSKKAQKAKKTQRIQESSGILSALDTIWAENQGSFPRWEGEGQKTRGHALRQQVRRRIGSSDVQKPDIEVAMRTKPEYREWQQWVFDSVRLTRRGGVKVGEARAIPAEV
jgi:hypothetical protein